MWRQSESIDVADVVIAAGLLIVAVGIYLLLGGAAAVIFVGVVLVIVGLLASWRKSQLQRSVKTKNRD